MHFVGDDMNELYKKICYQLYKHGADITTRGLLTREMLGVSLTLTDPRARVVSTKARNLDLRYMVGEVCFFLSGDTSLERIAHYSSFWNRVSDDGVTVNSAYGARLFYGAIEQFAYAVECLKSDMYSRKAVMPIYRFDDARESKDNPCTMFLQFIIRDDRLHCYTFMRSNDVWLGLPYDVAFFTLVQEAAYVALRQTYPKLRLGFYHHFATSLHCYQQHIEDLPLVYREPYTRSTFMPPMIEEDVVNWFSDLLAYEEAKRARGSMLLMQTTRLQAWLMAQL